MCGRFSVSQTGGIQERFIIEQNNLTPPPPRYNVAPTQQIPVILNDGANKLTMFRWGLIPSWAKEPSIGNKMINARAETLVEKPSFKTSLQRRRCLIPADGFYEWKREGNTKKPHRITLKTGDLFAFAGLWDSWQSPQGELIHSCTIITTEPNELMLQIHNRMPVILSIEDESIWLDPAITDSQFLIALLKPYPTELMTAYEVSPIVNSPGNDIPECLVPVNIR